MNNTSKTTIIQIHSQLVKANIQYKMLSAKFLAILPALASLANSLDDNYW